MDTPVCLESWLEGLGLVASGQVRTKGVVCSVPSGQHLRNFRDLLSVLLLKATGE